MKNNRSRDFFWKLGHFSVKKSHRNWLNGRCLTVSLSLSHWYPGSGVVLYCIDSWSLHPYLLWSWLWSEFILCRLLILFKINFFFSKNSLRNTIRVSNSLNPDQARHFVGHDLGKTVCKGYQQTTKVAASKERLIALTYMYLLIFFRKSIDG